MLSRIKFLNYLILSCVALLAFAGSLVNGFALDDLVHIVDNANVRSLSLTFNSFIKPIFPGNLYRPLLISSYGITYHFFGLAPFPYHLLNLVLHIGVVFLVFKIIKIVCEERTAFLIALIFACHPLHSEVVANISGRAELLAALFGLLSILSLHSSKYLIGGSALLLALLSKESAMVIVPLSILFWIYLGIERREIVKRVSVLSAPCFVYFSLRFYALGREVVSSGGVTLLDNALAHMPFDLRLVNAIAYLGKYISLMLLPTPLSADYSYAHLLPLESKLALIPCCLVSIVFCGAILGVARRSLYGFFAAWFFIAFLVTSNIFLTIGTIFAERLAYLPSVGIFGLVILALERLRIQQITYVLLPLAIAYSAMQSQVWRDNHSLHTYQMDVSQNSAKTQLNYAMVMKGKGDLESASIFARQALETYPDYDDAAWVIGNIYLHKEILVGAEHWLKRALKKNPEHLRSLDDLARLNINRGRLEQAEGYIRRLEDLTPGRVENEILRVVILVNQKRGKEALSKIEKLELRAPGNQEIKRIKDQIHDAAY